MAHKMNQKKAKKLRKQAKQFAHDMPQQVKLVKKEVVKYVQETTGQTFLYGVNKYQILNNPFSLRKRYQELKKDYNLNGEFDIFKEK